MEKTGRPFPTGSQRRKPTLTLSFSELEQLLGKSAHTVTGKNWEAEWPPLGRPEGSLGCLQAHEGSPWGDRQRTWSTAASTRLLWPLHCQTLNTRYAAVGILVITHLGASFLLRHTSLGTYCSLHPDTARTLLAWESTSPARSFPPL